MSEETLKQSFDLLFRSFFDEQRRRQRQTYLFLVLGVVWMAIMGGLLVAAHGLFLEAMEVPQEAIRRWCIVSSIVAVTLWGVVALVLQRAASRVLPLLMGARTASGVDEQTLKRVAEEIPLAAGESPSMLRWYVLENSAPNAFACGRSVSKGSILVTRGLLDILDREELQAVLAHELAHLKNGDSQYIVAALAFVWMVIGVCTVACAGLILALAVMTLLAVIGFKIFEADDSGWGGLVGIFIICILFICGLIYLTFYAIGLGILLCLVAIGVKAASSSISQSREYLADACAAQWTRNPLALASALAKISDSPQIVGIKADLASPLWLDHPEAETDTGFRQRLFSFLFHTHPSIERRISLLRDMAGSSVITEAQWLLAFRPNAWQRFKEWALPVFATILAVLVATALIKSLIF